MRFLWKKCFNNKFGISSEFRKEAKFFKNSIFLSAEGIQKKLPLNTSAETSET